MDIHGRHCSNRLILSESEPDIDRLYCFNDQKLFNCVVESLRHIGISLE